MDKYNFSIPQDVTFGKGVLAKLPKIMKNIRGEHAFIIAGKKAYELGIVDRAADYLKEAEVEFDVFTDIEAGPTVSVVNDATSKYKNSGADTIIAIGGGTVMDISKAVAILARYGGEIEDYEGFNLVPGPAESLVFIPTTAGSGSETTGYAEIIDEKNKYRFTVFSFNLLPEFTLLDPELILDIERKTAAELGIEALTNAIEAYISKKANVFTDSLCEKAIELIGEAIRPYVDNRADIDAAEKMLSASLLAGLAASWTGFGLAHSIAGVLSANFDISFARANAICLEEVVELNGITDKGKYYQIFRRLNGSGIKKDAFNKDLLRYEIAELIKELKIDDSIATDNCEYEISELAKDVMESNSVLLSPVQVEESDVVDILNRVL